MKRKILVLAAIVAAGLAAGLCYYRPFHHVTPTLRLPGTVETQEVRLSSKIGGRVRKVAVAEGDLVQPGQPLVYLEAPELEKQRDQCRARLNAAQAQLEKVRNGARSEDKKAAAAQLRALEAKLARLVAGNRAEEIEQARAELEIAEADRDRANLALERERTLQGVSASARQQMEEARAAAGRWQGQVKSMKARLDLLLAGTRAEDIAEARAEVERVRANVELLDAGSRSEEIMEAEARVGELQSRLEELDVNLREAIIVAPEAAVVEVLSVRPGDMVAVGQPVVRVLRADDLWVKAYVPEPQLGKVAVHQIVKVTVDSHPGIQFDGEIVQIASVSEFTPRNVQSADERRYQVFALKVRVADPRGVFRSGMAADVIVTLAD